MINEKNEGIQNKNIIIFYISEDINMIISNNS